MDIDLEKTEVGDIIWECEYGASIKTKVLTKPVKEEGQWKWKANVLDNVGGEIDYLVTEGMEHYGPRLYKQDIYARR